MLSVLFNLGTQPPSLLAGFTEFELEVSAFLGYGSDRTLWTTEEEAEIGRTIQEAYRYILYPSRLPGGGLPHVWSWLRQVGTVTTVSGTDTYTLDADFGSMHTRYLTYAANTYWLPIERTSAQDLRERKQWSSQTSRPWLYALEWEPQTAGLNQRQRIIFYPTPDDAYPLSYEYAILIGKLSRINPFPLGGPRISQLMIEACKAVGEAKKNGARGDQWNIFKEELGDAIALDASTLTERTVGKLASQYDEADRFGRPSRWDFGIRSLGGSSYSGVI
jgi:hypothetical protein